MLHPKVSNLDRKKLKLLFLIFCRPAAQKVQPLLDTEGPWYPDKWLFHVISPPQWVTSRSPVKKIEVIAQLECHHSSEDFAYRQVALMDPNIWKVQTRKVLENGLDINQVLSLTILLHPRVMGTFLLPRKMFGEVVVDESNVKPAFVFQTAIFQNIQNLMKTFTPRYPTYFDVEG